MAGSVRDCYGNEFPILFRWPDGIGKCPLCAYPLDALDDCQNPACNAAPWITVEVAERRAQAAREREAWKARHAPIDYSRSFGR